MYSTATLATVAREKVRVIRGLDSAWPGATASGRAFTARGRGGDNLVLHRALAAAGTGQVIVADVGANQEAGHWGELMAVCAQTRGVLALVVNGAIRDRAVLLQLQFPVFHVGVNPLQATKVDQGELAVAVHIQGELVEPGDLVSADDDGVVVVPALAVSEVFRLAAELEARERALVERLAAGETTMSILEL